MLIETVLGLLTDLGNIVMLAALAAAVAACLIIKGSHRPALALMAVFIMAAFGIGMAKLLSLSCHINPIAPDLRSPSGHVALSAAIYGMIASILAAQRPRWQFWTIWALASGLIALIAVSRVLLGYHSPIEAETGLVIGLAAFLICRRGLGRETPIRLNIKALALIAILIFVALHGIALPIENVIQDLAHHFRQHVTIC